MLPKKVILVFKTHFDIGFTQLSGEILEYYSGDMLDRVKATCDVTREMGDLRYVWTMPSWPVLDMLKRCEGERREHLLDLIKRRQLVWHALPYTSHYDACGLNEAIHGLSYAKDLSDSFGIPAPCAAKMTDVPGHGRYLAELLADAGIRFLHIGCNEFAMPPEVPSIFWWEAPSGKRVLTMYNSGYGTTITPPEDWPFDTWIALMNTNDNSGPQTPELVSSMVEKIHSYAPDAEIICGTLDDFWNAVSQNDLSELPVIRDDLADTWIHGAGTYPRETAQLRRLRGRLIRLAKISADRDEKTRIAVRKEIDDAYDAMALFAEHTWGLDTKRWLGAIPDYENFTQYRSNPKCVRMEASWKEQSDRVLCALDACSRAERILSIEKKASDSARSFRKLKGECVIENALYRISFNADEGRIHEVYDKTRAASMLRESGNTGVFDYRYDRYGSDDLTEYLRSYARRYSDWGVLDNGRHQYPECGHAVCRPVFMDCKQDADTVVFRYKTDMQYGDARELLLYVTVPAGCAAIRIRFEILGKQATPYIESGSLCMPLGYNPDRYYINKLGNIIDPGSDIIDNANHAFYAIEHFAAAKRGNALTCIVSYDVPLLSIGENGVHTYRKKYRENDPEFRFNLFNNMWGTNFPQWIDGDMSFEFEIFAEDADGIDRAYLRAAEIMESNGEGQSLPEPFVPGDGVYIADVRADGSGFHVCVHSISEKLIVSGIERSGWVFTEEDIIGRKQDRIWADHVVTAFAPYELKMFYARKQ